MKEYLGGAHAQLNVCLCEWESTVKAERTVEISESLDEMLGLPWAPLTSIIHVTGLQPLNSCLLRASFVFVVLALFLSECMLFKDSQ